MLANIVGTTFRRIQYRSKFLRILRFPCLFVEILTLALILFGCQSLIHPGFVDARNGEKTSLTPESSPELSTTILTDSRSVRVAASPGLEGFGANTPGGRAGKVIMVTNLNDSGPGSLRAAIEEKGPRTVVFRVAGTIELRSSLDITNPYITITGQTAPGQGITLRDIYEDVDPLIDVKTHDVIIQYLSLRAGPPTAGDAMNIASRTHDAYNVVVDHNSMSWGVDQVFATWYDVHDVSIQWNIFSEALDCSIHPKGCHSKGPMLGSYSSDEHNDKPGAYNISFHHNLMAHNGERNPLIKTSGICDVVNNVVYDPFYAFIHVDMEQQLTVLPTNIVGNYFKSGPSTDPNAPGIQTVHPGPFGAEIYVHGNIGPQRTSDNLPEIDIVAPKSRKYLSSVRHSAAPVTTSNAFEAYQQVLADAGANKGLNCSGTFVSRRDAIDARIINDVMNGTGEIIDDPSEVGGWLNIAPAIPCTDTDLDGMPDVWEKMFGFDPNDPLDNVKDANGDGYTNLEEYLNGMNPISK